MTRPLPEHKANSRWFKKKLDSTNKHPKARMVERGSMSKKPRVKLLEDVFVHI